MSAFRNGSQHAEPLPLETMVGGEDLHLIQKRGRPETLFALVRLLR